MKKFEIQEPEVNDLMFVEVGPSDSQKLHIQIKSLIESSSHHAFYKRKYKEALEVLLNDLIILAADGQPIFGDFQNMNTNVRGMKINNGIAALVKRTKDDLGI